MPYSASPSRHQPAVVERPDLKAARTLDPNSGRRLVGYRTHKPSEYGIAPYGVSLQFNIAKTISQRNMIRAGCMVQMEGIQDSLRSLGMDLEVRLD